MFAPLHRPSDNAHLPSPAWLLHGADQIRLNLASVSPVSGLSEGGGRLRSFFPERPDPRGFGGSSETLLEEVPHLFSTTNPAREHACFSDRIRGQRLEKRGCDVFSFPFFWPFSWLRGLRRLVGNLIRFQRHLLHLWNS